MTKQRHPHTTHDRPATTTRRRSRAAATAAALALTAGATLAVAPGAQAVEVNGVEVTVSPGSLQANVLGESVVETAEQIAGTVRSNENREGFVAALLEATRYKFNQEYDVVVIKDDHPYSYEVRGLQFEAAYDPVSSVPGFRVFVFESGEFTNEGDGGFGNWKYRGNVVERDDTGDGLKVVFD